MTRSLERLLDVQPDTVKIPQTPSQLSHALDVFGHHQQAFESKANPHPGVGNLPGLIEHMGAHGRGANFQPVLTGQDVDCLPINGRIDRLKDELIHARAFGYQSGQLFESLLANAALQAHFHQI